MAAVLTAAAGIFIALQGEADRVQPADTEASPAPLGIYEALLTKPFGEELPSGYGSDGVSRFVYADAGPPGLVGAAEVALTPPSGTQASLTFDVFDTDGSAASFYEERASNTRRYADETNTDVVAIDLGHPAECAIDELEGAVCVSRVGNVLIWARAARETSLGLVGISDQATELLLAGVRHLEALDPSIVAPSPSEAPVASEPNAAGTVLAEIQSLGVRCENASASRVHGRHGYESGVCDGKRGQIEVLVFKSEYERDAYETARVGEPDFATGARFFLATGDRTLIIMSDAESALLLQETMGGCVVDQVMVPFPGYCDHAAGPPVSPLDPDAGV